MRTGQRGFTLVELIVVIVLTGIIAGSVTIFFKPTIDAYFDARRRAELTDVADTVLQRISRDVRSAVPNSIRPPTVGNACFEFLPTSSGGRYRRAVDIARADSSALDINQPATTFDVLSPMATPPAVGDWVVIGNQNTDEVYSGLNRSNITLVAIPNAAVGTRTLSVAPYQFTDSEPGGRFVVVPNNGGSPAMIYACDNPGVDANGNGTGTLYRVSRGFANTLAACPGPAGGAVLATGVAGCAFDTVTRQGFITIQLVLSEAGESVAMAYGVHVSNVP